MLTRYRGAAIGLAALVISAGIAWGAGLYSTLPIVGGSSFCASTVSGTGNLGGLTGQGQGTLGSICAQTVPAGPSVVTGNELIPADEPNVNGQSPQTVVLTLASLNAMPTGYSATLTAATSANTVTVPSLVGNMVILGTAALSSTVLVMPPNPIDGQQLGVTANQTIATFSISPLVNQIMDAKAQVTAITSSTTGTYGYRFVWRAATTTWYRLL
jgi:hypothetical protein